MKTFFFSSIKTRVVLVGVFLLFFSTVASAQGMLLQNRLERVLEDKKATVGVAVKLLGEEAIVVNNEVSCLTMSVYKFHLGLAILDSLSRADLPLDMEIEVSESELLEDTYSPIKKKYPNGGRIKISELLHYTVSLSDNNTCDILFRFVGGTQVVDRYIRGLGIENFLIAATEEEMHAEFENQYLNWTTSLAAVEVMEVFLTRELFAPVYKEFLYDLLVNTKTGKEKLKAGLPAGTLMGHKTGSSFRTEEGVRLADNDLGFVRLPDGRVYCIGVFVKDSLEDDETNARIIAEVSRVVYEVYEGRAVQF